MKRLTQRERVKRYLVEHGSISNVEAFTTLRIFRLSERIRELVKEEGFELKKEYERDANGKRTGEFRYTLASRPAPKPKLVPQYVTVNGVPMVRLVPETGDMHTPDGPLGAPLVS